ncbi:MAG: signal peptide peptidase SppA [candidate division Zixibacteria bacterium]|nr:signal peptide peptidase SppA [candidate division Zixibacteria bacterium]
MRTLIISIFLVSIFLLSVVELEAVRYPYPYFPQPEHSVSAVFGPLSILTNPAALALNQDIEMMFLHSFNKEKFGGDNSIMFSRSGFGFAWQQYRLNISPTINSYSLAFGSHISNGFYYGLSYRFMKTDDGNAYHNDHFWDIGAVYQPNRRLSLGFTANNLRRMEFGGNETEIEYVLSGGYRPFPDRVTLSADWQWSEGEAFGDGYFRGYLSARIKRGWGVFASVDQDGFFGIGFSLKIGNRQLGSYHSFDDDAEYRSGVIYSGVSYRPYGWLLPLKKNFLKLKISGSYPETDRKNYFWQQPTATFSDLVNTLGRALEDDNIDGLYLDIDNPRLGWAQIQELRAIIEKFRQKNKIVVAYLGNLSGNGSYYLASAAENVAMRKVDALNLVGILAEVTFYKNTLDKLGIEAELQNAGKFKSLADIYTRDSISEPHREAVNTLLDDLYDVFIDDLAENRGFTRDSILELINSGPFISEDALAGGLIDTVLYPDQIDDWLEKQFQGMTEVGFSEYAKHIPYDYEWGLPDQLAIIPIEGSLVLGRGGEDLIFGRTVGDEEIIASIRYARSNDRIKAVILRLNTPGGMGLASDLIVRELNLLAEKKPLVISMGNVAASAGYHIATAGEYIFAQPSTITGSIGVVYGKVNVERMREQIGLTTYHFKRGENADFYSSSTGFSDSQKKHLRYQLDRMYDNFVQTVAESRNLSFDYVDSVAQGRVWSGSSAIDLKLVDQFGGLSDAIAYTIERAGLDSDYCQMVSFPVRPAELFDLGFSLRSLMRYASKFLAINSEQVDRQYSPFDLQFLYMLPFRLKIY